MLLHYSVFAYSYRGFPLFVRPMLDGCCVGCRVPIVTVLHEYVYPWRRGGVRGKAWALTQRAALRRCDARIRGRVVVTAGHGPSGSDRGYWLPTAAGPS